VVAVLDPASFACLLTMTGSASRMLKGSVVLPGTYSMSFGIGTMGCPFPFEMWAMGTSYALRRIGDDGIQSDSATAGGGFC
jgi:hypothetical protein